ncbi:MAG: hypothetical protein ABS89_02055 [Thiobacillus sp. SCN 63-1177]|nr:MAG: hypothetical protein ABS89_02055 [Thiobacillus sp. SCN 63-1177]
MSVFARAADALVPDGCLVVLDFRQPENWPLWLVRLGVLITKPFGVSLDLAVRKPWEVLKKRFQRVTTNRLFGGFVYIAVGESREPENG